MNEESQDPGTGLAFDPREMSLSPEVQGTMKHFTAPDGTDLWRNIGLGSV